MAPPRQAPKQPPIPIPLGVSLLRSTAKVVSVIAFFLMLFNSAHAEACPPGTRRADENDDWGECAKPAFIPGPLTDFRNNYRLEARPQLLEFVPDSFVTIPAGSAVTYEWDVQAAFAVVNFPSGVQLFYPWDNKKIFVVIYEDNVAVEEWDLTIYSNTRIFTHISTRSGRWKLAVVNWSTNEETVNFQDKLMLRMACSANALDPYDPNFSQGTQFSPGDDIPGSLACPAKSCGKDAIYWKQSASTAKDCVKLNHVTDAILGPFVDQDPSNTQYALFNTNGGSYNLAPGQAIRTDLAAYRSEKIIITFPAQTAQDLWGYVFENGVAIDRFAIQPGQFFFKQYQAAFPAQGPNPGLWEVSIANWGPFAGSNQQLFYSSIQLVLYCSNYPDYILAPQGISACMPVCNAGQRMQTVQGQCVSPTFGFPQDPTFWQPRYGEDTSHLFSFKSGMMGWMQIAPLSTVTYEWPIRADFASFEFVTKSREFPDVWAAIYENDVFVAEWHLGASSTQTFTLAAAVSANAAGKGKWKLAWVNWGAEPVTLSWSDDELLTKVDFMCTVGATTSRNPRMDLDFYVDGYNSKCPPKSCELNAKYWKDANGQADCVAVNHVAGATTNLALTAAGDAAKQKDFSGVSNGDSSQSEYVLNPGQAIRTDLTAYRSDTLQLSIAGDVKDMYGAWTWPHLWVHVFENGVAIDNFRIVDATSKVYKAKGKGLWQVSTAHWGGPMSGGMRWQFGRMGVTLTCENNPNFVTNAQGVKSCIPIPVCAAGTRLNADNLCVEPVVVGTFGSHLELDGSWASTHDHQPSYLLSYKWANIAGSDTTAVVPPLSARTYQWSKIRALFASFELKAQAGVSPDVWVAIYKNGHFMQEWQASATTTKFTLPANVVGTGVWTIALVNWGATEQTISPADVTIIVDLTCTAASTYTGLYKNPLTDLDFYQASGGDVTCPPKACPMDAKFMEKDDCVQVKHGAGTINFEPPNGNNGNKKILLGYSMGNLNAGQAIRTNLVAYRSDTLQLVVTKDTSIKDLWVHVFENGVAIDMFPLSTWDVSKTYKAAGQGANNGLWQVTVANWHEFQAIQWNSGRMTVTLTCADESDFMTDGQGVASCFYVPCVDPAEHRVAGICTKPKVGKDDDRVTTFLVVPVTSSVTELNFVGSTSDPVEVQPRQGGAVADFVTYRADTLKVKVAKQVAPTLFVRVYENGKLVSGGEFSATVTGVVQTFTATQEQQTHRRRSGQVLSTTEFGVWSVAVVNWAVGNDPVNFVPDSLEISLSCASGEQFTTVGGIQSCLPFVSPPPTPPPPATTCGYTSAVGFNVWARWNVFTLGDAVVDGGSVSGRIGATGTVSAINAAHVHTTKEAFISAQENHAAGGPWSITAKGAVTLTGTNAQTRTQVSNGGVESAALVTATHATVEDNKIKPEQALSADVDDAAEYFTERSAAWSQLAPSSIETDIAAKEISVQLHGKVNVVADEGLTVAELGAIEKITLTGNPSGTVIINVKGPGTAVLSPKLQVTYQGRGGASSATPESPTFGRVVLNLVDATGLQLDAPATAGTPTPIVHVSILAPKAVASFAVGAPEVRGNVVVKALTAHNDLSVQPFGTLARRSPLPPAPKRAWTSAGRSATACLWHTL